MASTLANWNGIEMPLEKVTVPALDRAFLFGDAVYEVIRVYRRRAWKLGEHLDRLRSSLRATAIAGPEDSSIRSRVTETLSHSEVSEGLIYIQITRGAARRTHYFPETASANMLVYVEEFQDPYAGIRETGVSAITYPDIRWGRNEIKVTSLLANCLAAQAAREAGASESILIDATGFVTEGSHTSVFAVREGKVVVSPAAPNILPGITKRQVLSLAGQGGIELMEGKLSREDLWKVDEVFLTGTPEEILPAVIIDGRPVGGGTVGPVTRKLQQTFRASLESWLKTSVVE